MAAISPAYVTPAYVTSHYEYICKFVYALLNEQWGLCVYATTLEKIDDKWLVLKPDEINMELFLDAICNAQQKQFTPRIRLHR